MSIPKICLDMDDVVADWRTFINGVYGYETIPHQIVDNDDKDFISTNYPRIFRHLALKPGAKQLVDYCRKYAEENGFILVFLTAILDDNRIKTVYSDKIDWANEHFPGIPVLFGPQPEHKQHHCQPGDILIDDRPSNCVEWIAKGGIAHEYTTFDNCLPWLMINMPLKQM